MINDWNYGGLLQEFLDADYEIIGYPQLTKSSGQLILRHDIDFDCALALEIAKIEAGLGVKSTFFFMLSSPGYNPLAAENRKCIEEIAELGHTISLHFDPTAYTDYAAGLEKELEVFAGAFAVTPNIVSLHRPAPEFLEEDRKIAGVEHTYLKRYGRDITYLSDSTGAWRFGHPLESEAFSERGSIQLLTHPVWWTMAGATAEEKLRNFYARRRAAMLKNYAHNCKPFENIVDVL